MIIVLKGDATDEQIMHIEKKVHEFGLKTHLSRGQYKTLIGAIGDERKVNVDQLKAIPYVDDVLPILKPYKLVSREFKEEDTIVEVDGVRIGGKDFTVMVGLCLIESENQYLSTAKKVKELGTKILCSVFKLYTSPYEFQGRKEEELKFFRKVKKETRLVIETEVTNVRQVELLANYVDIFSVGARNMQNFDLLKEVGKINKPVILKRGMSATIKEFLLAAEYIMSEGNHNVILCERGIRTFETATRNTLDLNAVALLKEETHLPIIVDPSHGTGKRNLVIPLSRAAIAAGADGLLIEVHPNPEEALSDGDQSLTIEMFREFIEEIRPIAHAMGKTI